MGVEPQHHDADEAFPTAARRVAYHVVTAVLLLPTLIVATVWAAYPLRARSYPLPPLSPVTTWTWRISTHYVTIKRIDPDVPFPSAVLAGLSSPTLPQYGVTWYGRPYLDPFGWIGSSNGYYLLGYRVRPAKYWSFSLILPLLATAPTAWLAWRRLRQPSLKTLRRRTGLCVACGYDLRATPDRCPECGTAVAGGRRRP